MKRKRIHDTRWDYSNRVEWAVNLSMNCGVTLTVCVMAPPDATDMELLTSACSKLKRQQDKIDAGV